MCYNILTLQRMRGGEYVKKQNKKRPSWDYRLGDIQKLEYAESRMNATVTLIGGATRQTTLTFSQQWPQGAYMDSAGKTYDIG